MACIYQGLFPGVASDAPSDPRGDLFPCTVSPVDPFSAVPAVSAVSAVSAFLLTSWLQP